MSISQFYFIYIYIYIYNIYIYILFVWGTQVDLRYSIIISAIQR